MPSDTETSSEDIPHLLVVDDSRLMRRAIGKILGKEYQITEAADGEEAWTILQSANDIKVIFSDLSMPNLDGFGLLERIRTSDDPAISDLPVIIITGAEDDDETKHKALNNGASDFISKPFESVQLRTRAKTHVQLDETHKKLSETETQLEEQARIDRLTGLSNKKAFDAQIVKDLSYAKRHRGELTLIFLEITNFQSLFLKFGKEVADDILKNIAKIALASTRNEDTLARIGLAKLAYILPSANRIGARRLSERVSKQVADLQIKSDDTLIPLTANVGIAAIDINNNVNVDDIINIAEQHLQTAIKQDGASIVIDEDEAEIAPETVKEITPAAPEPLEVLPDMDTAVRIAASDEAGRLQPHLATLLKGVLPLLKLCNNSLKLGIDDAIAIIEKRLEK